MTVNLAFPLFWRVSVQYKGNTKTLKNGGKREQSMKEKASYGNQSYNGQFQSICYLPQENNGVICIGAHTYNLKNEERETHNRDQKI